MKGRKRVSPGAVNTYTFLDERGCGKSWVLGAGRHFQSIQLLNKDRDGSGPSSRAAREMLPLCLRKGFADHAPLRPRPGRLPG